MKGEPICYHNIVENHILELNYQIVHSMATGFDRGDRLQTISAKDETANVLSSLLGSLELEVMEFMWQAGEATVRQVGEVINRKRSIAYTTVMTVMGHLVDKGLLSRTIEGKRYRYQVVQGKSEFLYQASQRMIRTLVEDFGDLAVAGFLGEISKIEPDRLEQLRRLAQETRDETSTPK